MFLKSSHIIPIEGPNLSPGYMCVRDGIIQAIGDEFVLHMKKENEKILDLGEMVLIPGFVNAHCHLELTALGPLKNHDFVAWIQELVYHKNELSENIVTDGIRLGIEKLIHSGVTCVGDHISFNTPWASLIESPLRGILFGEVLGVIPEVATDIYSNLLETKKAIENRHSRFRMSISPHSIHAVHPDTLKMVLMEQPGPLSCHLAESQTEEDYFLTETGELARFIRDRKHDIRHPAQSGLHYLEKHQLPLSKLLVVHGNYLTPADLNIITRYFLSIVHCPGSHQYFGHKPFPVDKYLANGINIAVGTDSIASNTDLDFLMELRRIRNNSPKLTASAILKMATINGARALWMDNEIGSLVAGKKADVIGFKLPRNQKPEEVPLLAREADFLMINGHIINHFP